MNSPSLFPRNHYRRKIHYVDETLQKFLLIGLVVLEAVLASGVVWVMFNHLSQIIEDNLYRVHLAEVVPIMDQLQQETLILLSFFYVANLVALVLVDFIWRRHAYSILRLFMQLMGKTRELDFTADPDTGDRHQLLDLAQAHRDQDRTRLQQIREHVSRLEAADEQAMHDLLNTLDDLLPRPSTTSS